MLSANREDEIFVYLNGVSLCKSIAGGAVAVVVAIDALQPLHLLHDLHRILLDQRLVWEHVLLLGAAVQVCARQDVRNGSESEKNGFIWLLSVGVSSCVLPMEQHSDELDNDDGEEKEHEDDSNGLKVQVLFGDDDLGNIYYRTGLWSLY